MDGQEIGCEEIGCGDALEHVPGPLGMPCWSEAPHRSPSRVLPSSPTGENSGAYQPVDVGDGAGVGNPSSAALADDLEQQDYFQTALDEARRAGAAVGCPSVHNDEEAMRFYYMRHARERRREKERKNRARIKEALAFLRTIVPGLSKDSDIVDVLERTVQYLQFLRDVILARRGGEKYSWISSASFSLREPLRSCGTEPCRRPEDQGDTHHTLGFLRSCACFAYFSSALGQYFFGV
ncbi:uncharacterized protein LOC144161926 isoform X2 [Haemaphysalis longicornis]